MEFIRYRISHRFSFCPFIHPLIHRPPPWRCANSEGFSVCPPRCWNVRRPASVRRPRRGRLRRHGARRGKVKNHEKWPEKVGKTRENLRKSHEKWPEILEKYSNPRKDAEFSATRMLIKDVVYFVFPNLHQHLFGGYCEVTRWIKSSHDSEIKCYTKNP